MAFNFDDLFGSTKYGSQGLLTGNQDTLLDKMTQDYTSLGDMAKGLRSTYQGAAGNYFQNAFARPMQQQYFNSLRDIQSAAGRHNSKRAMLTAQAQQGFLNNLGAQRANFLNQERMREMQALNDLRAQQATLFGLQNQAGATALNRQAFENTAEADPGMLSKVMSLIQAGSGIAGMFTGGMRG